MREENKYFFLRDVRSITSVYEEFWFFTHAKDTLILVFLSMLLCIYYIFISLHFFSVCPALKDLISQLRIFANTDSHIVSNKYLYKRYDCK